MLARLWVVKGEPKLLLSAVTNKKRTHTEIYGHPNTHSEQGFLFGHPLFLLCFQLCDPILNWFGFSSFLLLPPNSSPEIISAPCLPAATPSPTALTSYKRNTVLCARFRESSVPPATSLPARGRQCQRHIEAQPGLSALQSGTGPDAILTGILFCGLSLFRMRKSPSRCSFSNWW